jgi:hypothetical protein
VYIPRRDTSSRLNALAGGRLFPGVHHHARFTVRETPDRLEVALASDDGQTHVAVRAAVASQLPRDSVFRSLEEAAAFFRAGSLGYSDTPAPGRFQGLELQCHLWNLAPLAVEAVESSFFDDRAAFPPGAVTFDSALLMRGVEHEWHAREDLCCGLEAPALLLRPEPAFEKAGATDRPD